MGGGEAGWAAGWQGCEWGGLTTERGVARTYAAAASAATLPRVARFAPGPVGVKSECLP